MSDKSAIEWTEATWNPVTGCSKVSPGCANCYAETISLRFGHSKKPWTPKNAAENVILHPERLDQPLRWRRPRMIFVNSMSDLFHEEIDDHFIARIFAVMAIAQRHTFQVLTKRPERARALLDDVFRRDSFQWWAEHYVGNYSPDFEVTWPLPNVWLGVSIENARFTWRADVLREIPAAVRFISAEPLLGSLFQVPGVEAEHEVLSPESRAGSQAGLNGPGGSPTLHSRRAPLDLSGIDWLIVGGESGLGHRPMLQDWAFELRDAALENGTAFFFKQWGGRTPKSGGRLLGGREWNEMPGAIPVAEAV